MSVEVEDVALQTRCWRPRSVSGPIGVRLSVKTPTSGSRSGVPFVPTGPPTLKPSGSCRSWYLCGTGNWAIGVTNLKEGFCINVSLFIDIHVSTNIVVINSIICSVQSVL